MLTDADMPLVARTLSEIAQSLAGGDDAKARVLRVLSLIEKIVPYERTALFEAKPAPDGTLLVVPDLSSADRRELAQRLSGYVRLIAADVTTSESAPAREDQRLGDHAGRLGRSHLAVPVVGVSEIVGVLFVDRAGAPYDEQSLRLLTIVAAQLGAYLMTIRMRQEELEHARQLGIALHRLQEMDRRKDEFLAMLGHELRNPLGAITTALRLIDTGATRTIADPHAKFHNIIDRQLRTLSRIVDDLLDASRVRLGKISLKRETVDLGSVVRRWMEAFGTTTRVQAHVMRIDIPDHAIVVDGDPVRLEQVLSNLMTNALKFTPAGGEIRVTVVADGDQAVLRVRDNGIGMGPDVLARAFDLFSQGQDDSTSSERGLGLGLSLVRNLVEKHGGTVQGFSEGLGHGSEFVVRLPLASRTPPVRPDDTQTSSETVNAAPLRVLVIEDNEDGRELLETLLRRFGHLATGASDGIEGLTMALADRPDAVLIDIGLPGLDGFEVARHIRQELPVQPMMLIAMTGFGQPEDRRRAADAGFDTYMVKPIDANVLRRQLARISATPQTAPSGTQGGAGNALPA